MDVSTATLYGSIKDLCYQTKKASEKYPWHLLQRTVLIWVTFFASGLSETIRPSTALDIGDRLNATMEQTSYQFTVQAGGGLAGCILSGLLADRLSNSQIYLMLFTGCIGHAVPTILFPLSHSLIAFYSNSFCYGLFNGIFHTASNVLVLNIWRNRNVSPYMYTMHLCLGIGFLVGPLLSEKFQDSEHFYRDNLTLNVATDMDIIKEHTFFHVDNLYLVIGCVLGFSSFGFIFYYFIERSIAKEKAVFASSVSFIQSTTNNKMSKGKKLIFIILMILINFLFSGVEGSFKSYIPLYSTQHNLHLSRQEGSQILSMFFGTYTGFRVLLIFGSLFLSATVDMWVSLALCAVGCIILQTWAETSLLGYQIAMCLEGAGSAAVYSTTFLWLEELMPVTNVIAALYSSAWNISSQIYTVIIASYIKTNPDVFLHLMSATVFACIVVFGIACIVKYFTLKTVTSRPPMDRQMSRKNSSINRAVLVSQKSGLF